MPCATRHKGVSDRCEDVREQSSVSCKNVAKLLVEEHFPPKMQVDTVLVADGLRGVARALVHGVCPT